MVKVRQISETVLSVTGFADKATALTLARKAAAYLQRQIALLFEKARTFRGALQKNDSGYELSKVLSGDDPRRGHKSGRLQSALYSVRLWRVFGSAKEIRIVFDETPLYSAVPYVEYFEEKKTLGGTLIGLRMDWVQKVAQSFKRLKPLAVQTRPRKSVARQGLLRIAQVGRALGAEVKVG